MILILRFSTLADWRISRNCSWNDNYVERFRCWVIPLLAAIQAASVFLNSNYLRDSLFFFCVLKIVVYRPVSGASMNPARSLGPAIVMRQFKGIWVYIVGPPIGTILGALCYNIIRFTDKPLREITKTASFLKSKN